MRTAESKDVRLRYEVSGVDEGDLLVLVNSLGSSVRMWDKALPALEEKHRVLRFDMRGHGESEASVAPLGIEQLGHDVLRLMDEVKADKASICGVSLGGLVGLWLGIHSGNRVDRLILANTAARIGTHEMWEQRIATVRSAGMSELAAATLERWFTPTYRAEHPEEMEQIREMIAATDPQGYATCCEVLRDSDLRAEAAEVKAASLVITGKHDPATPREDGWALHLGIPHSSYVELNASHMSAWECANEFAEAVLQHLAAGEAVHG
jgi:3-oxoadipate enol-lactonase